MLNRRMDGTAQNMIASGQWVQGEPRTLRACQRGRDSEGRLLLDRQHRSGFLMVSALGGASSGGISRFIVGSKKKNNN